MSRINKFVATLIAIIMNLVMTAPSAAANQEPITSSAERCEASWYGPGLQGNRMANGDRFDMDDPTVVAHKTLPFGTILIVTNLTNGRQMAVEVQDRGPFTAGRCVDLSRAGAKALEFYVNDSAGTTYVTAEVCVANCPPPGTLIGEETEPDEPEDETSTVPMS